MASMKENLSTTRNYMGKFMKDAPDFMKNFHAVVEGAENEGPLDAKTVELIMIGIAVKAQCSYCIEIHVQKALQAGLGKDEIIAAAKCAVVMGGGPSLMYVQHVYKCLEEFAE
jgi:AhpD family alkylhydroperoxidase